MASKRTEHHEHRFSVSFKCSLLQLRAHLFISLIFNLVLPFSHQVSLSYHASVTEIFLPVLSIADVKIQKTC